MRRHTSRLSISSALLVFGFGLSPQAGHSQVMSIRGFHSGTHFHLKSLSVNGGEDEGSGVGFRAGWGFNNKVMAFMQSDRGFMSDSYVTDSLDFGLRYHVLGGEKREAWYVEGSFTITFADVPIDGDIVGVEGDGFSAGVGLLYSLTPQMALDVGVQLGRGSFDTVRSGRQSFAINEAFTTGRLKVGMSWFGLFSAGIQRLSGAHRLGLPSSNPSQAAIQNP